MDLRMRDTGEPFAAPDVLALFGDRLRAVEGFAQSILELETKGSIDLEPKGIALAHAVVALWEDWNEAQAAILEWLKGKGLAED